MKLWPLTFAFVLLAPLAPAQQPAPATPAPASVPATAAATPAAIPSLRGKLIYRPVGRGAPAGRVDAGSRGDGDDLASLYVLAPSEIGLTTQAQPTLFWFQTKPADVAFEFSLLKPNEPEPVLHIRQASAKVRGFQHLDLAAHGVSLSANTDYQWIVALVRDPESRSRDIVSSGWIRRIATPAALGRGATPASYAAQGIWYDAVMGICAEIAARPRDAQLQSSRQDLLSQVGLPQLVASKSEH